MDSGAESGFIQQHWAKQYLPDIDSPVCQVRAINNTTVKSYDSRQLDLTIGDADGDLRDHTETVESVDMVEYDIILGFPWLERVDPDVRWSKKLWFYRPPDSTGSNNPRPIEVVSAHTCAVLALGNNPVYVLHTRSIADGDASIGLFGATVVDDRGIPMEYADYGDIFSEEEASILAPHRDHDHVVNTEPGKSPPLRSIYPLS